MKKLNTEGFSVGVVLMAIVIVILVAVVGWLVYDKSKKPTTTISENRTTHIKELESDRIDQANISAMSAQIEYYYGNEGYYPSKDNLADKNWTDTNFTGLAGESLYDQKGVRVGTEKSLYVYAPEPEDCTECKSYKLGVVLGDGGKFEKHSYN